MSLKMLMLLLIFVMFQHPEGMKDDDIKVILLEFGGTEGEIIHKICELNFYNNMRTVIMSKMDFNKL